MSEMFELVEIDPETGEVDQVLSIQPTTWAKAKAHLDEVITEMVEDWDHPNGGQWSWLRIQPA